MSKSIEESLQDRHVYQNTCVRVLSCVIVDGDRIELARITGASFSRTDPTTPDKEFLIVNLNF